MAHELGGLVLHEVLGGIVAAVGAARSDPHNILKSAHQNYQCHDHQDNNL